MCHEGQTVLKYIIYNMDSRGEYISKLSMKTECIMKVKQYKVYHMDDHDERYSKLSNNTDRIVKVHLYKV